MAGRWFAKRFPRRLTSDKLALADRWRAHGVPTPATTARAPTACEAFPVVWKPRDG